MQDRLRHLEERYDALTTEMADPEVVRAGEPFHRQIYEAIREHGSDLVTVLHESINVEVVEERPADITPEDVAGVLPEFTGEIEQLPPMVSAVKVQGQRLYKAARRGEQLERETRSRTVFRLELLEFAPGEHPEATLDVVCSGGTYVRTLVHDIGERLSCGAHLASLRRIESGGFSLSDAIEPDAISAGAMRPLEAAVHLLPQMVASAEAERRAANGRALEDVPSGLPPDGRVAVMSSAGKLLAVYRNDDGRLVAERVVGAESHKT
jgi:tRNA pseudouridine55 synthase